MSLRNAIAASGIALVLVYAFGSGLWVNTVDNWYNNLTLASFALITTAVLTIPMSYTLFTISIPMALAVMPYQVWVAIAATLSWSYSRLN